MQKTEELNLISSITSMEIQRIKLKGEFVFQDFPVGSSYWTELDDVLWKLGDRQKYKFRLEVEFRGAGPGWDEEPDLKKYLPRFHEKGRLVVIGKEGDLIYCSDGGERRK